MKSGKSTFGAPLLLALGFFFLGAEVVGLKKRSKIY